jgi:hypothetical protein
VETNKTHNEEKAMTTNAAKTTKTNNSDFVANVYGNGIRQVEFFGIEFPSTADAVRHAKACGLVAIHGEFFVRGARDGHLVATAQNLTVTNDTAAHLAAEGVEFAYVCEVRLPNGSLRIVTVPVND